MQNTNPGASTEVYTKQLKLKKRANAPSTTCPDATHIDSLTSSPRCNGNASKNAKMT